MVNQQVFLKHSGSRYPLMCGAMFPWSDPGLVGAVSAAGGFGEIQPVSFTYVHGYALDKAIDRIQERTLNPFSINILVEGSQDRYRATAMGWLDTAIDKGCRFVTTALGKPTDIVKIAHDRGAVVYHKVTNLRHAEVAMSAGVDGLIAVNKRAGGHAGGLSAEELFVQLSQFGVPLVCAGGVGDPSAYGDALEMGYAAVLMGTRFLASTECLADEQYKAAILRAQESDIVLTERVTGVPLAVINTPEVQRLGYSMPFWARIMMKQPNGKKLVRLWFAFRSGQSLKKAVRGGLTPQDIYQAGKSVGGITSVQSVAEIVESFNQEATRRGVLYMPSKSDPQNGSFG
jgi:nitronate monooxygenase